MRSSSKRTPGRRDAVNPRVVEHAELVPAEAIQVAAAEQAGIDVDLLEGVEVEVARQTALYFA